MDVHDAYHRLRITDQNAADDSIIANFVSCVSLPLEMGVLRRDY